MQVHALRQMLAAEQKHSEAQEKIIEGFKSGERYRIIQDRYDKNVNELRRMLEKVKRERDEARETTVHVRNIWFEVFDKLEEAYKKQEKKLAGNPEASPAMPATAAKNRSPPVNRFC